MQSLLHIGERIQERVIERHAETITRFLDILDQKVVDLQTDWKKCSYAAALGPYVDLKLGLHKLNSSWYHIHDGSDVEYWQNTQLKINKLKEKIADFKNTMYDNVCNDCPWCDSRKKNWPPNTQFRVPPVTLHSFTHTGLIWSE